MIMLAITHFVHKNTYDWNGSKLSLPLWSAILAVIVALIPIVNAMGFVLGAFIYISSIVNADIEFSYRAKWWVSLVNIMTRDLNGDE